MTLVDHENFLKQLAALFGSSQDKGSIWLTHKRLAHDGNDPIMKTEEETDTREYDCLVRMTNGKKVQFSTKVNTNQLLKFHTAYAALMKQSMTTLRRRDKKREKQRAELLARRKQRIMEPVTIEGPKRGKGRRQRQRRVKASLKQQKLRQEYQEKEDTKERAKRP